MTSVATIEQAAIVALGSNLANEDVSSVAIIKEAIKALQHLSSEPLLSSSIWQTDPVDCPKGSPVFVNAVVALNLPSTMDPAQLLQDLQQIEQRFGRTRAGVINEPRALDLDLIAFANLTCQSDLLILPHPRAHLRRFVLQPLCEFAADFILPGQHSTVGQLLLGMDAQGELIKITLSH